MAEEIIVKYKAEVDGFKADLKTVQTELKNTEDAGTSAATNTAKEFDKTTEKTKSLKSQLRDLKAQLANATDPKDIERLAKAAGKLTDQIEDATDAAKVFASESKFEQIGNAFGSVVSKLRNLDFSGAVQQSKLLVSTSKSLTFKEALGGVKDLGATLFNVGKSLLLNPIFLIGTTATLIIANFDKLTKSGGIVGKTFKFIGDIIGGVKDGFLQLTDAIGLTDTATTDLIESQREYYKQLFSFNQNGIQQQIKYQEALGNTDKAFKLRFKEQATIIQDALNQRSLLLKEIVANGGEANDEQIAQLKELSQTIANAQNEQRILAVKYNAEKLAKEKEINQKLAEEAERLAKLLRDLRTQNIESEYERRKQIIINNFNDESAKYKGHNDILIELEKKKNKELNDLAEEREAKNRKILEDAQKGYIKTYKDGVKDVEGADVGLSNTFKNNIETKIKKEKEAAEAIKQIRSQAISFIGSQLAAFAEIQQNNINEEIADNQEAANQEIAILNNQLETKEISQEVYNQRKKEIDKKAADEESKLRMRAFKAQQQAAYIQTIISTAQGVANALTVTPAQLVPAYIAIALATGAAQAAVIASQPTPKFEKGGRIGGKRHSAGGTLIEAEVDEYVINRKDAIKNYGLIEAINKGQAERFINQMYLAPILKAQQKKFNESKDNAFADNIVNSMMFNSGQFKDGNLLEALKRNRQSDRENAMYIVKELTKRSTNARSW